eukprot:TRINITY_DN35825_c0_g1_i1.p1 TRINITY_DN35825_c0_g1~~TRINITY_DN35825_c0_g1_i1.p1  ORF type:complete len:212 (-),score=28.48 TRINITY_DN35825_c0_g1_i1:5-640(-)
MLRGKSAPPALTLDDEERAIDTTEMLLPQASSATMSRNFPGFAVSARTANSNSETHVHANQTEEVDPLSPMSRPLWYRVDNSPHMLQPGTPNVAAGLATSWQPLHASDNQSQFLAASDKTDSGDTTPISPMSREVWFRSINESQALEPASPAFAPALPNAFHTLFAAASARGGSEIQRAAKPGSPEGDLSSQSFAAPKASDGTIDEIVVRV